MIRIYGQTQAETLAVTRVLEAPEISAWNATIKYYTNSSVA
jgi:hypothetical protein